MKCNCLMVILLSNLLNFPVMAVDVSFSGTILTPPPCTIDNGQMVDVDFGDRVAIRKVDGQNYMQKVNFNIICDPAIPAWDLGLSLNGTETSFNNAAVQTDKAGLGILITLNSQPLVMNTRISIARGVIPILMAVPVKDPLVTLTDGPFEATATLFADFQ